MLCEKRDNGGKTLKKSENGLAKKQYYQKS